MKIYKLVKDSEVVYVGRTKLSLSRRKSSGFYNLDQDFVRECEIQLIEETDDRSRERYWIDYYLSIGCKLLNKRNGDYKDYQQHYEEIKRKMRERRGFEPMTKEEKLQKRREYCKKNQEELNRKKREKYANGNSWYHRKKQMHKFFI
jgi:hypothetical protein